MKVMKMRFMAQSYLWRGCLGVLLVTLFPYLTYCQDTAFSASYRAAQGHGDKRQLKFEVSVPTAGLYKLHTHVKNKVKTADPSAIETVYATLKWENERPTKRIFFDRHNKGEQVAGIFSLRQGKQYLTFWVPPDISFDGFTISPYNAPKVPEAAQHYQPQILPSEGHPRLWFTQETLALIKARLEQGENHARWEDVKTRAKAAHSFIIDPKQEMFYNEAVEKAAEAKAFYYAMTGDIDVGREAIQLMTDYYSVLEFGNVSYGDISREIGRAIYIGALVYDWCYPLLEQGEKELLRKHMMRLARDMEIGWPPFYGVESIVNGHGNEAQICRDLLAMSIAIYDEDPLPYRYTSYTVLEQLLPMRAFEYQSPRHNQGVDYGAYRFGWEMHAVWLLYRMSGRRVFDENIKNLAYYWLYMRLPNGEMLRDGDMFSLVNNKGRFYWKQPQTMLLAYAYGDDPYIKGEFEREGGLPDNPILFLLVNDPNLKAEHNLQALPLTKTSGTILGSMVVRTGWDNRPQSEDVIAEIKGGGYIFGNHQHPDAGAIQLYHHGFLVGDIGLYLSYGPPYDFNFNKRSISHSMLLVRDPKEPLLFRTEANDGGARFNQRFPRTPEEVTSDAWFDNGVVCSSSFGPSRISPRFNYFKADLTGAYTSKVSSYVRGFCFLKLNRKDIPAIIILTDDITSADSSFAKYWQINTLNSPDTLGDGWVLHSEASGFRGKAFVSMLLPKTSDREVDILSGKRANSTFEFQYEPKSSRPEANAHRIMVSPKKKEKHHRFIALFQVGGEETGKLPLRFQEEQGRYSLVIEDQVVNLGGGSHLQQDRLVLTVPSKKSHYQVLITDLQAGYWHIKTGAGDFFRNVKVMPGENTLHFEADPGVYQVMPGRLYQEEK